MPSSTKGKVSMRASVVVSSSTCGTCVNPTNLLKECKAIAVKQTRTSSEKAVPKKTTTVTKTVTTKSVKPK
jgi:hypothetical protein